jgi:hypothetical protein
MKLRNWKDIPTFMKNDKVKEYYDLLAKKKRALCLKRIFDIVLAIILLIFLAIPMLAIALMVKIDSEGPVFYRQERVTSYGKVFRVHKFRTMVNNADKIGLSVTLEGDVRITRVGNILRDLRLDEMPQLLDVLEGNMSFVGTRPEVIKYVMQYTDEMYATLLLPAGITSEASIRYKNEALLLDASKDVDKVYVQEVLPEKMKYNLQSIKNFSFIREIATLFRTLFAVMGKEYK